jgi:hypothetical protein
MFKGGLEKSKELPDLYEAVAKMGGAGFLNAGSVISTDGLHLTAESEKKLGTAIAAKVKEMLKQVSDRASPKLKTSLRSGVMSAGIALSFCKLVAQYRLASEGLQIDLNRYA